MLRRLGEKTMEQYEFLLSFLVVLVAAVLILRPWFSERKPMEDYQSMLIHPGSQKTEAAEIVRTFTMQQEFDPFPLAPNYFKKATPAQIKPLLDYIKAENEKARRLEEVKNMFGRSEKHIRKIR